LAVRHDHHSLDVAEIHEGQRTQDPGRTRDRGQRTEDG
jgi:hypothetical protein